MPKNLLHHVPVFLGLSVLVLTLPVVLLNLQSAQTLKNQAAGRSFSLPPGAKVVPGKIIVKYRDNVELKTDNTVNQHVQAFGVGQITSGIPTTSIDNLETVNTRQVSRVFKDEKLPQEKSAIQRLLNVFGAGEKTSPLANYVELDVPSNANLQSDINVLLKDPNIESASPSYVGYVTATPNDQYYAAQQWDMPKISAPQAWDTSTGSSNITVAVIDTGVDMTHTDLQANLTTGYNTFDGSSNVQDGCGHGTHVSGTIGAIGNNSTGVAGVNWHVTILPIKVFDDTCQSGQSTNFATAVTYAVNHGAKVINMSLVATGDDPAFKAAIDDAVSKGVTVVASAGNGTNGNIPPGVLEQNMYPASYPNVITVSNTDNTDHLASSSNYGGNTAIAAPGQNIFSTMSTTINAGSEMATCATNYPRGYCVLSGTSMAAPHVAGVAALLLAKNSSLTPAQIKSLLTQNADDTGFKDPAGNEIIRLNAAKTLAAVNSVGASGSPSAAGSATPVPSAVISGVLVDLSAAIQSSCGGTGIIAKDLNNSTTNRNWVSYVANYNTPSFSAAGDVYVYSPRACSITLGATPVPSPTATPVVQASATPTPTASPTPTPTAVPNNSLYLSPSTLSATPSQTITLQIRANSTTPYNTVETDITYPTSQLTLNTIDDSTSDFSLAIQKTSSNGTITIDKGATPPLSGDHLVAILTFTVNSTATGTATIQMGNSSVLLSNSTNTNVATTYGNTTVTIGSSSGAAIKPTAAHLTATTTFNLVAGWNKITIPAGLTSTTGITAVPTVQSAKKNSILKSLLGL